MTTLDELLTMAAADNDVTADEILGRGRARDVTAARFQVYWVLRQSGWSYPAIGRALGRDHSTVRHGVEQARVRRWMAGVMVASDRPRVAHKVCTVAGCGRPHRSRGLCEAHRARQSRYGDPVAEVPVGAPHGQVAAARRTAPAVEVCDDCGAAPMAGGAVRCLDCFHGWLDRTHGRWRGTSKPRMDVGRVAVQQVRVPALRKMAGAA